MTRLLAGFAAALLALTGCGSTIAGTATWPGATLQRMVLTQGDFPAGVQYDRITDDPNQPDGAGTPPPMQSRPPGCSNALTEVIKKTAERGPGSALSYRAGFDGARITMTLLSWHLDLDALAATAARCEHFETFFDPRSTGIPMTTTKLPSADGQLLYQQTMELGGQLSTIYMTFANVDRNAVFGIVFPAEDPSIPAKATLPQTFTDVVDRQIARIRAS